MFRWFKYSFFFFKFILIALIIILQSNEYINHLEGFDSIEELEQLKSFLHSQLY